MKIFGHPVSTATRKVLVALVELDIPYDFVVIDFQKGEHKQPPHLARQPFGQIPAIDDDGFVLFESRAICRYLNEKVNGKLVPSELRARALMEQWISVESFNVTPHSSKFVYHHIFNRPQEAAVLEAAAIGLNKGLAVLETQLAKTAFLVGDELSLADIVYMPYIAYAMSTPAKAHYAKHPHVMTWWNKLAERRSWLKASGRA